MSSRVTTSFTGYGLLVLAGGVSFVMPDSLAVPRSVAHTGAVVPVRAVEPVPTEIDRAFDLVVTPDGRPAASEARHHPVAAPPEASTTERTAPRSRGV